MRMNLRMEVALGIDLRKPANLTLDAALIAEAKTLGINLSRAAEDGLRQAVSAAKAQIWKHENRQTLDGINQWVEQNGIPLAEFRQF
jgi:antitoxin CcdA